MQIDAIAYRKSLVDLNGNLCIITNSGQTPVSFDGWWLDSPKWDHVDRFYFPKGISLAGGASMNVHSGPGRTTNGDIYMARTTVMWDGMAYDTALLYDNYGREVARFFPAAEEGATPTTPPAPTPGPRHRHRTQQGHSFSSAWRCYPYAGRNRHEGAQPAAHRGGYFGDR